MMKTIESLMAGMMILLFVAALSANSLQAPSRAPAQGQRALSALQEKGVLAPLAAAMDYAAINDELGSTSYLKGYNHTVEICSPGGQCAGYAPKGSDVWVSGILVAGYASYQPMEVRVYVFR